MESIFENAYFGKPYRTRDGRKAIYWTKIRYSLDYGHRLICEELHCTIIAGDDGRIQTGKDNKVDIVSEYQEEISQEEQDWLAKEYAIKRSIGSCVYSDPFNDFKAGLRKALEYINSNKK